MAVAWPMAVSARRAVCRPAVSAQTVSSAVPRRKVVSARHHAAFPSQVSEVHFAVGGRVFAFLAASSTGSAGTPISGRTSITRSLRLSSCPASMFSSATRRAKMDESTLSPGGTGRFSEPPRL